MEVRHLSIGVEVWTLVDLFGGDGSKVKHYMSNHIMIINK